MKASEKTLKWIMRFYPPLFFQRIWVIKFHSGFKGVDVKIFRSIFNRNYNASIFGGTIFAAADPFYPILFDQIFRKKGFKTLVWLKSGSVKYIKPARSTLRFSIQLKEEEIAEAVRSLERDGKFIATYHLIIYNNANEVCAYIDNEIYVRDLNFNVKKDMR